MTAAAVSAVMVRRPFAYKPITSRRRVRINKGIIGTGRMRLSTTWLRTSAGVASNPTATIAKAGIIVMSRRSQSGMRNPTKPCMMTCPAIVPTARARQPGSKQRNQEHPRGARAKDRYQGAVGGADLCHIIVHAVVEDGSGHCHHRHVDETGKTERQHDLAVREPEQPPALSIGSSDDTILSEAGMQIDRVRHDRGADDADSEQDPLAVVEVQHDRMERNR